MRSNKDRIEPGHRKKLVQLLHGRNTFDVDNKAVPCVGLVEIALKLRLQSLFPVQETGKPCALQRQQMIAACNLARVI